MLLCPCGDVGLRTMQGERCRGGSCVFGGVGVAQHDLHTAARRLESCLHIGDLEYAVEYVDRVIEVVELLEERDDVDVGQLLGVREGVMRELVDRGDVARRLRERDDVAPGGIASVATLDETHGPQGGKNLPGHRLQLPFGPVLAQVFERTGVHEGMLANLHLHHAEAKRLHLPDEPLHRSVGLPGCSGLGKGALYHAQVRDELLG